MCNIGETLLLFLGQWETWKKQSRANCFFLLGASLFLKLFEWDEFMFVEFGILAKVSQVPGSAHTFFKDLPWIAYFSLWWLGHILADVMRTAN
jgi:hypothetical protein